ncbi:hypothetical protein FHS15_000892 [Paenibacillus castaneae]|nr:hypothetical protein [Paenibacillus castaneae]NIK75792.1 hypothetical protein [Paenibacillus castaneae]
MAEQYGYLIIWLLGLFGIIGIVIYAVARFAFNDSLSKDDTD